MDRLLGAAVLIAFVGSSVFAGEKDYAVNLDVAFVNPSGLPAWTNDGVGKLRYDSNGATLSRLFASYSPNLTDTLSTTIVLDGYDDDLGPALGISQSYLEWRPVPRSANRYRLKVGAFYPKISMENSEDGWSSPYSLSSSSINTWVAEELRTLGAEISLSRRPVFGGGRQTLSFDAAVFWGNDPAGSLLAWRGWSLHDRQSRIGDKLPLPDLPQFQPGMMFELQAPFVDPFREVDDRAGYYLNAGWELHKRFRLRVMHYDNRGNPEALNDGQYAWQTKFNHLGIQSSLGEHLGIIAQWMQGFTRMGPFVNGRRAVDVGFESYFLLVTRAFSDHRVSIRFDRFRNKDEDFAADDANNESGNGWSLSYEKALTQSVAVNLEWIRLKTERTAWQYAGLPTDQAEDLLQLTMRVSLGNP